MDGLKHLVLVLKTRGVKFFLVYFYESLLFDIFNGTNTSSRVPKNKQNITGGKDEIQNGLLYVASFSSVTRKTLAIAKQYLSNMEYTSVQFIDLGCGKGKAVLVYLKDIDKRNKLPAIGIEYDQSLVKIANNNIEICNFSHNSVRIVQDSAVNVSSYISSDVTIIYLYNSFQGETLYSVLKELLPVKHILIYVDPAEREVLRDYGYKIIQSNNGSYNADTWLIAANFEE